MGWVTLLPTPGSDDVFLCSTPEEAETAFERIFGTMNGLGQMNNNVLVQEFLVGKEYVIDKVSNGCRCVYTYPI